MSVGYVALNRKQRRYVETAFATDRRLTLPADVEAELESRYWATVCSCPTFRHQDERGDRSAKRISDLVSRRQYHSLPIYNEYLRPGGVEHGLEVPLSRSCGRDRFLILWRTAEDVDFTPATCALLEILRPHFERMLELSELRRRVGEAPPTAVPDLTARELEVLELVRQGKTNAQIAQSLWVAPSTVTKHLEHVYDKLGVRGRTAAALASGYRVERSPAD